MEKISAIQLPDDTFLSSDLDRISALREILTIGEVVEITYPEIRRKYYAIYHKSKGWFCDTWQKK